LMESESLVCGAMARKATALGRPTTRGKLGNCSPQTFQKHFESTKTFLVVLIPQKYQLVAALVLG